MKIVRGILAIIVGIIAGSAVNLGIILLGGLVVAPPEGMNVWDAESIKALGHLFTTKHFIAPFLAHSLGTLVGAFVAAKIAPAVKLLFALAVGCWFMLGGIYVINMIPTPMWFVVLDIAAYIPMALIGGKLGSGGSEKMGTDVANG